MSENVKTNIRICLHAQNGFVKQAVVSHTDKVMLQIEERYKEGDYLSICTDIWPIPLRICLDKTRPAADIWLTANRMEFQIPFKKDRGVYPVNAFSLENSYISVEKISQEEWEIYRNLSENPWDKRGETSYYPHCRANAETRDEAVFAARNTIDGVLENSCHGEWPYQSWGEDENQSAEIMIEFGRRVLVDKVTICLRADFPHDNYWKEATLLFSDGSREKITLKKTKEVQKFVVIPRKIEWVKLIEMIRGEEESPFPALTQWAVYGKNV